jgi:hypothetical protein
MIYFKFSEEPCFKGEKISGIDTYQGFQYQFSYNEVKELIYPTYSIQDFTLMDLANKDAAEPYITIDLNSLEATSIEEAETLVRTYAIPFIKCLNGLKEIERGNKYRNKMLEDRSKEEEDFKKQAL